MTPQMPPPLARPPMITRQASDSYSVPKTSAGAVVSLIFGIIGCIPIFALVSLIVGIVALNSISHSEGRLGGKGMAIAGIILSSVMLLSTCIGAVIMIPMLAQNKEKARQSTCYSNQRQITAAIQMYAQDHEETLPSISTIWQDINVDAGVLVCPSAGKAIPNGYGYNAKTGGIAVGDVNDPMSLILTADGGNSRNLLTGKDDIQPRHSERFIASYCDGHVSTGSLSYFDGKELSPNGKP